MTDKCSAVSHEGLYDKEFYDSRYRNGYLSEWPVFVRERVTDVIGDLRLPESGTALDFGCGNGQFTALLKELLPGWQVTGMDISSVAIDEALRRFPGEDFKVVETGRISAATYDFIFTHHVLEHVPDLGGTWSILLSMLKRDGSMLHVLPCGNKGSFEYWLSSLHENGIDKLRGGRFFYEDAGHLRRMTTDDMLALSAGTSLELRYEAYCSHFFGACDWVTRAGFDMIRTLCGPAGARDSVAACTLGLSAALLTMLKILRYPSNSIETKWRLLSWWRYGALAVILAPLYPLSKAINLLLGVLIKIEWKYRRAHRDASEMFLYLKRKGEVE